MRALFSDGRDVMFDLFLSVRSLGFSIDRRRRSWYYRVLRNLLQRASGRRVRARLPSSRCRAAKEARMSDRKSTRLNSSHTVESYAVFRLIKIGQPLLRRT